MLILWLKKNGYYFINPRPYPNHSWCSSKNKQLKQLGSKTNFAVLKVVTPTRLDHTKYSIPLACPQIRRISPPFPSPPDRATCNVEIFQDQLPLWPGWWQSSKYQLFFPTKKGSPTKKQTNISWCSLWEWIKPYRKNTEWYKIWFENKMGTRWIAKIIFHLGGARMFFHPAMPGLKT